MMSFFASTMEPRDGRPGTGAGEAVQRVVRLRRIIIALGLLAGLYYVGHDVTIYSGGAGETYGLVALAPFGAAYLVCFLRFDRPKPIWFWSAYGLMLAFFVAELPFAHAEAFVMCQYIAMVTAFRLREHCIPAVAAMTLAAVLVPPAVPSWGEGFSTGVDNATAVMIPLLALIVIGALHWQRANVALSVANAEIARLAAENERARIARDLHDLLGHSLTTITVKAGLARRLAGVDIARAASEIAAVEELARRSLSDVRAAVSSYRDVTLAGEIAAGREMLRAAGITADLPGAVDEVPATHSELLGWAVREGLTNVVRHARANWCAVRLLPSGIEVVDDGGGHPFAGARLAGGVGVPPGLSGGGNGLAGLRERVGAAGGTLEAGPLSPNGWSLRVSLPPEAPEQSLTPALSAAKRAAPAGAGRLGVNIGPA
ncbi:MAG TPA: sensor histidine kinase [Acidimicrobiales bacterium]|nr:sensor histidine kinase [Acidimicrobiales bacterium]